MFLSLPIYYSCIEHYINKYIYFKLIGVFFLCKIHEKAAYEWNRLHPNGCYYKISWNFSVIDGVERRYQSLIFLSLKRLDIGFFFCYLFCWQQSRHSLFLVHLIAASCPPVIHTSVSRSLIIDYQCWFVDQWRPGPGGENAVKNEFFIIFMLSVEKNISLSP